MRPPIALGSSPELPAFTMSTAAPPVPPFPGISRKYFIHGSHLVVRDQSGLAASA